MAESKVQTKTATVKKVSSTASNAPNSARVKEAVAAGIILAEIEIPRYHSRTGKKLTKSSVQAFNIFEWRNFIKEGPKQGWAVLYTCALPKGAKPYVTPTV